MVPVGCSSCDAATGRGESAEEAWDDAVLGRRSGAPALPECRRVWADSAAAVILGRGGMPWPLRVSASLLRLSCWKRCRSFLGTRKAVRMSFMVLSASPDVCCSSCLPVSAMPATRCASSRKRCTSSSSALRCAAASSSSVRDLADSSEDILLRRNPRWITSAAPCRCASASCTAAAWLWALCSSAMRASSSAVRAAAALRTASSSPCTAASASARCARTAALFSSTAAVICPSRSFRLLLAPSSSPFSTATSL
mmetsp:Transcript_44674/g.114213  ORF Transcript_44674/g.114213 Transcript_44674/m.114213 type:complete len:254 (+) Transcript_44674:311-1072(+)